MGSIRRARPNEAQTLTDLALRSKAFWGYDAEFIESCRAELTVTPEMVEADETFVLEDPDVSGFYLLRAEDREGELRMLFVDPERIGSGIGRELWDHVLGTARRLGMRRFIIESDPNAEAIYLALGARRIGETPSGSVAGRALPLLEVDLQRD